MVFTKAFFPIYVTIIAMVTLKVNHCNTARLKDFIDKHSRKRASAVHPCDNVANNTVVHTINGDVVCRLPSDEKLRLKLDVAGGYNRHYVSTTFIEARENFKNLFATYGTNYTNTSDWQSWHIKAVSLDSDRMTDGNTGSSLNVQKRETGENTNTSSNIQCLAGGRETPEGVHLCPACQRCTELPINMYPRYVNELTCDDSHSGSSSTPGCFLSGNFQIGTCRQINMTIDLLSHPNGRYELTFQNQSVQIFEAVYESITKELRISCECLGFAHLINPK